MLHIPRRHHLLVVAAAVLATVTACGSGAQDVRAENAAKGSDDVLRIGDQNQGLELPLRLSGQQDGTSYKLDFNTFEGGPLMTEAFAAGDLDVGAMGDTPAVFAAAAKLDLVVIAVEQNNGNRYTVISPTGSKVKTTHDLLGKKVAYTQGTAGQGFALRLLKKLGKTERDIQHVDVPLKDVGPALESGRVDAALVSDPQRSNYLKAHPDANQVVESKTLGPGYQFVLATREALEDPQKRAHLKDFVARITRAGEWRAAHGEEWTKAYYEDLFKQTPDVSAAAWKRSGGGRYIPITPEIQQSQQELADLFTKAAALPGRADVSAQFDEDVTAEFNQAVTAAK
jgi:sulfonate transport system substrate-binding protein